MGNSVSDTATLSDVVRLRGFVRNDDEASRLRRVSRDRVYNIQHRSTTKRARVLSPSGVSRFIRGFSYTGCIKYPRRHGQAFSLLQVQVYFTSLLPHQVSSMGRSIHSIHRDNLPSSSCGCCCILAQRAWLVNCNDDGTCRCFGNRRSNFSSNMRNDLLDLPPGPCFFHASVAVDHHCLTQHVVDSV